MDKETVSDDPIDLPHHHQSEFCRTRPAYRQGRRLTAVKVLEQYLNSYAVRSMCLYSIYIIFRHTQSILNQRIY